MTHSTKHLAQILRLGGYPRLVSLESFRKPNFRLMADILYWLTKRLEPNSDLTPSITTEADRILFIRSVVSLLNGRTRLPLDPALIYRADASALPQLILLSELLVCADVEGEQIGDFGLPVKFDKRKARELVREVTEGGLKLFELLGREKQMATSREKAVGVIDGVLGEYKSSASSVENQAKGIVEAHLQAQNQSEQFLKSLESRERELLDKIRRRKLDLERLEKKLRTTSSVKPSNVEEIYRLERELEKLFAMYLEKMRNLDFLENECDKIILEENKQHGELLKYLEKVQMQIRNKEEKMFENPLAEANTKAFKKGSRKAEPVIVEQPEEGD